ncbi:MAG TPA: hypothetical protein P5154_01495 [Candidatus Izemoplasmatales bacterium]|nr:hypothetical protein [Bacillota bacterium]HRY77418.1 hypothetical protein [Candidatus Izemoplasmatales bacterium]
MIKKKMTMSLVALIGASLMFIVATFAWLTVSEYVNSGITVVNVSNADTTATLQMAEVAEGPYTTVTSLIIPSSVPGDVFYYRLAIENTGEVALLTSVYFRGFTDAVGRAGGDPTNFNNGQTLRDILIVDSYYTNDSVNVPAVTGQTFNALIGSLPMGIGYDQAVFGIAANIPLAAAETEYVYFSLTVSDEAGTDYENLRLAISQIQISSVSS